tara:strand:+ start:604 stop:738 length:135 start_codon:yes stop_codon:yes gene_type:complete
MERIELIHSMKRAYRWLASGAGLPIPYDEALARIARGVAVEVQS